MDLSLVPGAMLVLAQVPVPIPMDPDKAAAAIAAGDAKTVLAYACVALALVAVGLGSLLYRSLMTQIADGKENGKLVAANETALRNLTDAVKLWATRGGKDP